MGDEVNKNRELINEYIDIFLKVSKKLQRIDSGDKADLDDKEKLMLEEALSKLSVIYGYFVEFDPYKEGLEYFIDDSFAETPNQFTSFKPTYIPYLGKGKDQLKNLFKSVRDNSKTIFKSFKNSPKVFQHLPIQVKHENKFKNISDYYLNCFIPCKIKDENDYFVVLFDEIVFFQVAYKYVNKEPLNDFFANKKQFLFLYLIKFALSFEAKIVKSELHKKLEIQSKKDNWNNKPEIELREQILEKVETIFKDGKEDEYLAIIIRLVEDLLSLYRGKKNYLSIVSDIELLKLISRFDIETSFQITDKDNKLIPHDMFVFPLYTQSDAPVLKTKFIDPNYEVSIYSPVLLILYIKTLYIIKPPKYDEDEESINGFQLTKEITKLFAQKLIQEEYLKNVIQKELQPAAIRAAISQVMARNTSHNIGAHVMNKLIGNLRELDFLSYERGKNYCTQIQLGRDIHKDIVQRLENNPAFKALDSTTKEEALRNELLLGQIAIFNHYVKCRMDYLADISFGTPLMQTNKYAYADLFKELDKVRLLLEHISGLGENFTYEIKFKYNNDKEMSDEDDLPIAIPNDILGMQAFYNILENIIRNTAKHARQKPPTTSFTLNFIDKLEKVSEEEQNTLNDYIVVEIYDNIPVDGIGRDLTSEEKKEYERVMAPSVLDNFASEIDALVFSQNSRINTDILQDNQLRSGALGVIEMDASATYLRKRDVSFINHDNYTLHYDDSWSANSIKAQKNDCERGVDCRHFLKAFKKEIDKDVVGNPVFALGYRFFLLRPEVVLIITNIEPDKDSNKVKELKKQGVWIVHPDVFEKHLTEGKVYNHEFVIITKIKTETQNNNETEIKLITYKTSLPLRILYVQEDELKTLLVYTNDGNKKDWLSVFEDFCWKKWEINLKKKYNFLEYSYEYQTPIINSKTAIISNHLYSKNHQPKEKWNELIAKSYYVEPAASKAQLYMPGLKNHSLNDYPDILERNIISKIKLAESILTKVLVIDERVQDVSDNKQNGISQQEIYKKMGVYIPKKSEMDLSKNTYNYEQIKRIKTYIERALKWCRCDMILIHYSILERIFNLEQNRVIEINNELTKYAKKGIKVIVTSGRGIPDKLTSDACFLNLSSTISAFNDIRSKFYITSLMYATRKSNKK